MLMTWIIYYSPHIFSLRSKDQLIRFNDSYPSIKILINVEKYEFAIELSDHSVAWTSTKNPFLLKHPTDLYLLAVQNSRLGFCHENYIKFVAEFNRKEDIPH